MGWHEHSRARGSMVGDDAHDVTHDFLQRLSQLYREQFGRGPTLDEVRLLLETGLYVSGPALLSGMEGWRVVQAVFKTQKRPRDQAFKVGDLFAIPLGDSRVAFGRVMMLDKMRGMLVEVFRKLGRSIEGEPGVTTSGRLFHPLLTSVTALREWRWIVVAPEPDYHLSAEDSSLEFASPGPRSGWVSVDLLGKIVRTIDEEESRQMERGWVWPVDDLEARICEASRAS